MGKQHIIELNGKRYDALTGHQLSVSASKNLSSHHTAKSMDGLSHRPHPPRKVSATSSQPHKPQKAHTLMRNAVRRPVTQVAPAKPTPLQKHASVSTFPSDKKRLERAKKAHQSHLIRRFGPEVMGAKVAAAKNAPKVALQAVSNSVVQRSQPFQNALAAATGHQQPKVRKTPIHHRAARKLHLSPKVVNAAALSLAAIFIVGFFVYQNIPNLAMRVASMRADVEGSLPSYKPSGFSLSSAIQYKPGQITLGYKSKSDDRNFQITQRASDWDSQSLLANYVAPKNKPYQTVKNKGKTVYLYEGSNATWVDGGVWYTIEGESMLNSRQLQDLAASL